MENELQIKTKFLEILFNNATIKKFQQFAFSYKPIFMMIFLNALLLHTEKFFSFLFISIFFCIG